MKTHKTAGTSIATIIQRYGFTRNLTFAIPNRDIPVFDCTRYFQRTDVFNFPADLNQTGGSFDMLTNHAVYNRPEMDATVPEAFYITSLRDPVDQFESAFVYYNMKKQVEINDNDTNPIATFLKNAEHLRSKIRYGRQQVQNGQIYDLGLSSKQALDPFYVNYKIKQLDNEFDLVLIKEYFDESLILMKKLFCWEIDDILYIPKRIRNSEFRLNINQSLRHKIMEWNYADMLLYDHFNRTLWRKIEEYGADFWRDLHEFRKRIDTVSSMCQTDNKHVLKDKKHHLDIIESANKTEFCINLFRMDGDYTTLIGKRMSTQNTSNRATSVNAITELPQNNNTINMIKTKATKKTQEFRCVKGKKRRHNIPIKNIRGKLISLIKGREKLTQKD